MAPQSTTALGAQNDTPLVFPGENPGGHHLTKFFEQFRDAISRRKLTAALTGADPERTSSLVDLPVSETAIPTELRAKLANDPVGLRKLESMAVKAQLKNTENARSRATAKREDDDLVFTVIAESMRTTAPSLRRTLLARCELTQGGYPGYYSGRDAIVIIHEHCASIGKMDLFSKQYQKLDDALRLDQNQLKPGCSTSEFEARVTLLRTTINPNLDRPYEGTSLGKAIINMLPVAYLDARERLLDTLVGSGQLDDIDKVVSECFSIVARRTPSAFGTSSATVTSDSIISMLMNGSPNGADDEETVMVAKMGAGRKGNRGGKKSKWVFDLTKRTCFCPRCPHKSKDGTKTFGCYSNPGITFTVDMCAKVLAKKDWHEAVVKSRTNNARALGITPVPFPPLPDTPVPPAVDSSATVVVLACEGSESLDDWGDSAVEIFMMADDRVPVGGGHGLTLSAASDGSRSDHSDYEYGSGDEESDPQPDDEENSTNPYRDPELEIMNDALNAGMPREDYAWGRSCEPPRLSRTVSDELALQPRLRTEGTGSPVLALMHTSRVPQAAVNGVYVVYGGVNPGVYSDTPEMIESLYKSVPADYSIIRYDSLEAASHSFQNYLEGVAVEGVPYLISPIPRVNKRLLGIPVAPVMTTAPVPRAVTPSITDRVRKSMFGDASGVLTAAMGAPAQVAIAAAATPQRLDFGTPRVERTLPVGGSGAGQAPVPREQPVQGDGFSTPRQRMLEASTLPPQSRIAPGAEFNTPAIHGTAQANPGPVGRAMAGAMARGAAWGASTKYTLIALLVPLIFCALVYVFEAVSAITYVAYVGWDYDWITQSVLKVADVVRRVADSLTHFATPAITLLGGWKIGGAAFATYIVTALLVARVNAGQTVADPAPRLGMTAWRKGGGVPIGDIMTATEYNIEMARHYGGDGRAAFMGSLSSGGTAGRHLLIGDSGAGRWMGNERSDFESGSFYPHRTSVLNAGGSDHVCSERGTMFVTLPTSQGPMTIRSPDSVYNASCPYKLISLAQLTGRDGAEIYMPGWGRDGYIQFTNGARATIVNSNVWLIPSSTPESSVHAFAQVVTRGKHDAATVKGSMTGAILHARFGHCSLKNLHHIHTALDGVPPWWVKCLDESSPCDVCLRGVMNSLPGTGPMPKHAGLLCYDVWQTPIPFVHGGHRYQIVFLHPATNVSKSYRLKVKSDAPIALEQGYVWFTTVGRDSDGARLKITWLHTDLAPELSRSKRVQAYFRSRGCRVTTTAPGVSRSNPVERRHQSIKKVTAKALIQAKLPLTYHAYAWEDSERKMRYVPTLVPPHTTPYEALTGEKPRPYERPFGCLSYVKVPNPNKIDADCRRGLCFGYANDDVEEPTQACYSIYVPSLRRMIRSPHVTFVEDCFPGLSIMSDGEEQMGTPTFAPDYVELDTPEAHIGAVIDSEELPPGPVGESLTWLPTDFEYETFDPLSLLEGTTEEAQEAPPPTQRALVPAAPEATEPRLKGKLEGPYWQAAGAGNRRAGGKYGRPSASTARAALAASLGEAERDLSGGRNGGDGTTIMAMIAERSDGEVVALAMLSACSAAECGGPDEMESRKEYAGECARAAIAGIALPAYEPLFSYGSLDGRRGTIIEAFREEGGSHILIALDASYVDPELALAASTRGIVTHRLMQTLPDKALWNDAMVLELDTLVRLGAFEKVRHSDPRIQGRQIVDTMFTGVYKPAANGRSQVRKARCVIRGDMMKRMRTSNQNNSPTIFDSSFKCCQAVKTLRGMHEVYFDFKAAYVQGKNAEGDVVVARAPAGHREFDEDGKETYWLMSSALYGQSDAGAVWNRTLNEFSVGDKVGLLRNDADPSLYSKTLAGGGIIAMPIYVDDGELLYDPTPECAAEVERIKGEYSARFKLSYGATDPTDSYFLSKDIIRHDSTRTTIRSTTYIRRMGEAHLTEPLDSFPNVWTYTPASKDLARALEAALAKKEVPEGDLMERYGSLVMAMMYKSSDRPDITTAVCMLSRAMHYPTRDLMRCATRVLVYLMRNEKIGITYSSSGEGARKLRAQVDSNWSVTQSTSGFVAYLAGATVSHYHRRQHCIAMSSCEAELMALSVAALELLFLQGVLEGLGYMFEGKYGPELETVNKEVHSIVYRHGPPEASTDSKAAYDSCHRESAGQYSRHIARRVYKMRELCGGKRVKLVLIGTADNSSDIFTKVLDRQLFEKHRSVVMNLTAA